MEYNIILDTDSYKHSHWKQYPEGTEFIYSYAESRGGLFSETVVFGLTYYLKKYLSRPITRDQVDYAEDRINKHMGPDIFNREGWNYIIDKCNGILPVRIKYVPEGFVVPTRNIICSLENTDSNVPWLVGHLETTLLRNIWYPITVATLSRECKKLILRYLEETGSPEEIQFKLHDFGSRACTCSEQAEIGGMAHLLNFRGSDTIMGLEAAKEYYGEDMAGFSIPAAEHSTICSWGREHEVDAFENMIKQFGDGSLYAVVSDSYNIYDACEKLWGGQLRNQVQNAKATLVVRPDSGVPHVVVRQVVEILANRFGYDLNDKNFKVLKNVRVIQGDGINLEEIGRILEELKVRGWSADNIAFGMGGALLQKMDRDTQKFAFKASSAIINGRMKDIYKEPITDNGKFSKRGRLKLIEQDGILTTVSKDVIGHDVLQTVWENGELLVDPTFAEIRERAELAVKVW